MTLHFERSGIKIGSHKVVRVAGSHAYQSVSGTDLKRMFRIKKLSLQRAKSNFPRGNYFRQRPNVPESLRPFLISVLIPMHSHFLSFLLNATSARLSRVEDFNKYTYHWPPSAELPRLSGPQVLAGLEISNLDLRIRHDVSAGAVNHVGHRGDRHHGGRLGHAPT